MDVLYMYGHVAAKLELLRGWLRTRFAYTLKTVVILAAWVTRRGSRVRPSRPIPFNKRQY